MELIKSYLKKVFVFLAYVVKDIFESCVFIFLILILNQNPTYFHTNVYISYLIAIIIFLIVKNQNFILEEYKFSNNKLPLILRFLLFVVGLVIITVNLESHNKILETIFL